MNKTVVYITGNRIKYDIAVQTFENTGIAIVQKKLDTPEIQSTSVEEVARYSAIWGSNMLNQPAAVTDAGFYIEALNGFPGPFIKYINQWLSALDIANLMRDKANRDIVVRDCLAYCKPGGEPVVFTGEFHGKIAYEPGLGDGTPIEKLFIPQGYDTPISDIPRDEAMNYWSNGSILRKFRDYLLKNL